MPSSVCYSAHPCLPSFPTPRSSDPADLNMLKRLLEVFHKEDAKDHDKAIKMLFDGAGRMGWLWRKLETSGKPWVSAINGTCMGGALDRKSTRLNSSHPSISYAVFCLLQRPPMSTLFPYTTLFRSCRPQYAQAAARGLPQGRRQGSRQGDQDAVRRRRPHGLALAQAGNVGQAVGLGDQRHLHGRRVRSEEHTSELQSPVHLVCRLLSATAPTHVYPLSLHHALPILPTSICSSGCSRSSTRKTPRITTRRSRCCSTAPAAWAGSGASWKRRASRGSRRSTAPAWAAR